MTKDDLDILGIVHDAAAVLIPGHFKNGLYYRAERLLPDSLPVCELWWSYQEAKDGLVIRGIAYETAAVLTPGHFKNGLRYRAAGLLPHSSLGGVRLWPRMAKGDLLIVGVVHDADAVPTLGGFKKLLSQPAEGRILGSFFDHLRGEYIAGCGDHQIPVRAFLQSGRISRRLRHVLRATDQLTGSGGQASTVFPAALAHFAGSIR
jgi:hypothetical protein